MKSDLQNIVRNACVSFTVATAFLFPGAAMAESPDGLKGATLVDATKAKSLIDAGGITVVDSRTPTEFAESRIKGAINIPYKEKSAKAADFDASQDSIDLTKLPADKKAGVLFYCNGAECWKGYKSSSAAVKAGHTNVYWFRLGLPAWKAKNYPTE